MASAVTPFGQWLNLTREKPHGDINKILNDAVKRTYIFGRLVKGMGEKVFATGSKIVEKIKLTNQNSGGAYRPGEPAQINRLTTSQTVSLPPRFYRAMASWTDAEEMLQGSDRDTCFNKFKTSVMQDLETDCWNMVEDAIHRQPSATLMETEQSAEAGLAYSIPSFITENTTGAGAYLAPGWQAISSTLEQLNPTTNDGFRNYQKTYSVGSPYGAAGIFTGMDDIMLSIKYEPPQGGAKQYFESDELRKCMILTNKAGRVLFQEGVRQGNDQWKGAASSSDPSYGNPVFNGYPIEYVAAYDTVTLEETAGAYTGAAWANPRYIFLNGNHLHPILMNKGGTPFDTLGPMPVGGLQADTDVLYKRIWWNLFCHSRKRQAILHPTA